MVLCRVMKYTAASSNSSRALSSTTARQEANKQEVRETRHTPSSDSKRVCACGALRFEDWPHDVTALFRGI